MQPLDIFQAHVKLTNYHKLSIPCLVMLILMSLIIGLVQYVKHQGADSRPSLGFVNFSWSPLFKKSFKVNSYDLLVEIEEKKKVVSMPATKRVFCRCILHDENGRQVVFSADQKSEVLVKLSSELEEKLARYGYQIVNKQIRDNRLTLSYETPNNMGELDITTDLTKNFVITFDCLHRERGKRE